MFEGGVIMLALLKAQEFNSAQIIGDDHAAMNSVA